jgi:hypothetical protein
MTATTLDDLMAMSNDELYAVVQRGTPLDTHALADTTYTGIDLSMPAWFHRLMWKTFRKTFHLDLATGALRGWNVKVEQTGWEAPPAPKRNRRGEPLTFGHYEVRPAEGLKFPRGWQGGHYLDYRVAGNRFFDFPARAGYCPLVSVNPGSSELLLGWEVFKVAGLLVPINDFWVLRREGPLAPEDVVPRPDGRTIAPGA